MKANNKIVWILAFAPLLGLMLESAVAGAAASHPAAVEAAVADALHHGTYWYLTLGLNLALLLWEARRLKAAGVAMSSLGKWAFVVPVYLWQRARLLGHGWMPQTRPVAGCPRGLQRRCAKLRAA